MAELIWTGISSYAPPRVRGGVSGTCYETGVQHSINFTKRYQMRENLIKSLSETGLSENNGLSRKFHGSFSMNALCDCLFVGQIKVSSGKIQSELNTYLG